MKHHNPKSAPEPEPEPEIEQPKPPLPPLEPSLLPQVEEKVVEIPLAEGGAPKDNEFTDGIYRMKEGNHAGEDFALCIHEPDTYGKTHSAKNSLNFWQGNEKEFKSAFEKP